MNNIKYQKYKTKWRKNTMKFDVIYSKEVEADDFFAAIDKVKAKNEDAEVLSVLRQDEEEE